MIRIMLGDDVLEEAHVQASSPESDRYSQYFDSIACMLCYRSDQEALLLLCDHCNDAYHCGCLSPPLPTVPEGTWYCPRCSEREVRRIQVAALSGSGLSD
ncbi:histone-lysine N-methyltransferase ATXR6 isoform X1 [Galendromus occidentalis]|uniref:Histone-lysine N-methyltransferase ATXR6 isoform X1 n=1 Tax=Galendromus occidentalis TaxID=34638 RepID=A0AAJ7L6V5_9ACAR|nr:histone-lysine N-methyltransferase ATXR6 isoform X1 [Galendromus occidentalis]